MTETKKGALWNTAAGILNAAESVVMSMVATRTDGLEAAGILVLAFAIGNLFRTIGLWGMRTFQVSDQNGEFSFREYLHSRFFSILLMGVAGVAYSVYLLCGRGYSWEKTGVIFLIIFVYVLEGYEDILWGEYQRRGRIDIGAKLFLSRWGTLLIFFGAGMCLGYGLLPVLAAAVFCSVVVFFGVLFRWYGIPTDDTGTSGRDRWFEIIRQTFPLFAATFLVFYLNNIAKYSIDRYYDDDLQACFGFIAMPVFVVELLSGFIYQPKIVFLTELWKAHKYRETVKEIRRQLMVIVVLSVLCIVGGHFLGIPVLSIVFAVDLSPYKTELLLMLLAGGEMALVGYSMVWFTIIRKQKWMLLLYLITTVVAAVLIPVWVKTKGIYGAAAGSAWIQGGQAAAFYAVLFALMAAEAKGIRNHKR